MGHYLVFIGADFYIGYRVNDWLCWLWWSLVWDFDLYAIESNFELIWVTLLYYYNFFGSLVKLFYLLFYNVDGISMK